MVGSQVGSKRSALAISQVTSDAMQNSGGAAAVPKERHNIKYAMWLRMQMQVIADFQLTCMCQCAGSKSILLMKIGVDGYCRQRKWM